MKPGSDNRISKVAKRLSPSLLCFDLGLLCIFLLRTGQPSNLAQCYPYLLREIRVCHSETWGAAATQMFIEIFEGNRRENQRDTPFPTFHTAQCRFSQALILCYRTTLSYVHWKYYRNALRLHLFPECSELGGLNHSSNYTSSFSGLAPFATPSGE